MLSNEKKEKRWLTIPCFQQTWSKRQFLSEDLLSNYTGWSRMGGAERICDKYHSGIEIWIGGQLRDCWKKTNGKKIEEQRLEGDNSWRGWKRKESTSAVAAEKALRKVCRSMLSFTVKEKTLRAKFFLYNLLTLVRMILQTYTVLVA